MRKYTDERVFMNTSVSIQVFSEHGTVATHEIIAKAFSMFDLVVKRYTRFDETSELSRLNKSNGSTYKVSKELFELIKYMLDLSRMTDEIFDPTVIDLLELYGFDANKSYDKLNDPQLMPKIKKYISKRPSPLDIELDETALSVTMQKGQRLDLGSIGKGFAVDLAFEILNKNFDAFLINAGGDVRMKSHPEVKPYWSVELFKAPLPNQPESEDKVWGELQLEGALSVAGSGGWVRRIKFFHHLLNPKSGLPENTVSQSFAIADKAISADVWATILFLMGEKGMELAKKNNVEAMIVTLDGSILRSENF